MAETAEEAEMRELEEGVARLNDAGAPLLEAEDALVIGEKRKRDDEDDSEAEED